MNYRTKCIIAILVVVLFVIFSFPTSCHASSQTEHNNQLIDKAKSRIGCRYVYGAAGSKHFDCSGFVYWSYKHSKVPVKKKFKRTSCHSMYHTLKNYKVSNKASKAKRGDIILYKNHGRYTHTAIALGHGKMIHASSGKRKVCVGKINQCKHSSLAVIRIVK